MQSMRGAAFIAAAAVLTSGLAACGGDEKPTESSSTVSPIGKGTDSPSSSTSGSAGSKKTTLPPAAQQNNENGAIAFTELWFENAGKALQDGDAAWLDENTDQECKPCTAFVQRAQKDGKAGLKANRDPIDVRDISATPRSDSGYRVKFTMVNPAYAMIDSQGNPKQRFKAVTSEVVTDTQWVEGKWVIKNWILK